MSALLFLIYLGVKRIVRYPWGFLVSVFTDPIILIMNIILFTTLYNYNQKFNILGYSLNQMIWYFAASTFCWYWIWNFTDRRIAFRILNGELAQDLLRPVSLFTWEFGFAVALRIGGVLFEFVPNLLIYSLIFHPEFLTFFAFLRFLVAIMTAFVLFYLIKFLIGLGGIYIQNSSALQAISLVLISLTGGAYIPLEFFPAWVQTVLNMLPFAYLFYWPVRFFLNREIANTWEIFLTHEAIALVWVSGLFIICQLSWKRALRDYSGIGG